MWVFVTLGRSLGMVLIQWDSLDVLSKTKAVYHLTRQSRFSVINLVECLHHILFITWESFLFSLSACVYMYNVFEHRIMANKICSKNAQNSCHRDNFYSFSEFMHFTFNGIFPKLTHTTTIIMIKNLNLWLTVIIGYI